MQVSVSILSSKVLREFTRTWHQFTYGAVHSNPAKCGQHTPCKGCGERHPCPARN